MTLNFWISRLHLPCAKITGKCESQGLVYAMLETIKPRSSCMLGKHSTNYAASPPYRVISTSFLSLESKNRTRKEVLYSAPSILCLAVAIIAKMSSQTFSFPDSEKKEGMTILSLDKWNPEPQSDLSKVTQLPSSEAGIQAHIYLAICFSSKARHSNKISRKETSLTSKARGTKLPSIACVWTWAHTAWKQQSVLRFPN